GMSHWIHGSFADAERTWKEMALPDEEVGYVSHVRPFGLAWVLAERGAFGEARACAHGFINCGRAQRLPLNEGRGRWVLAEVLREGELDAAEEEIQTALSILRTLPPLEYPGALATLAALRLAQGRCREALAVAEEALSQAEAIGACSRFFRDAFLRLVHAEC